MTSHRVFYLFEMLTDALRTRNPDVFYLRAHAMSSLLSGNPPTELTGMQFGNFFAMSSWEDQATTVKDMADADTNERFVPSVVVRPRIARKIRELVSAEGVRAKAVENENVKLQENAVAAVSALIDMIFDDTTDFELDHQKVLVSEEHISVWKRANNAFSELLELVSYGQPNA